MYLVLGEFIRPFPTQSPQKGAREILCVYLYPPPRTIWSQHDDTVLPSFFAPPSLWSRR